MLKTKDKGQIFHPQEKMILHKGKQQSKWQLTSHENHGGQKKLENIFKELNNLSIKNSPVSENILQKWEEIRHIYKRKLTEFVLNINVLKIAAERSSLICSVNFITNDQLLVY